jgi:hypothetical protein
VLGGSGTYSLQGTQISFGPAMFDYCVENDRLHLIDAFSATNATSGMQATTIARDIVLQKQ